MLHVILLSMVTIGTTVQPTNLTQYDRGPMEISSASIESSNTVTAAANVDLKQIRGRGSDRLFALPIDATGDIVELDPWTGAEINRFPAPEPSLPGPEGLAFNGKSLFYYTSSGSRTLWEIDPDTGAVLDADIVTVGSGDFDGIAAVAGALWLLDYSAIDILQFDPVTDTIVRTLDIDVLNPGVTIVGGICGMTGPDALIATQSPGAVFEIDPSTGLVSNTWPTATGTLLIWGVAAINGEIWIGTGTGAGSLHRYDRNGALLSVTPLPYNVSALGGDDPDNIPRRLFAIPDDASGDIVELDLESGAELNRFLAPSAPVGGPDGLAFDGNSLFFFADDGSGTLWEIDPNNGAVRDADPVTAGSGFYDGIAAFAGSVWIMDHVLADIHHFDPVSDTVVGTLDIDALNPGITIVGGICGITGPHALIATNTIEVPANVHEIDPGTGLVTNTWAAATGDYIFGAAASNGEVYLGSGDGPGALYRHDRAGVLLSTVNLPYNVSALGADDAGTVPWELPIFADGFESGDTSAWTTVLQ